MKVIVTKTISDVMMCLKHMTKSIGHNNETVIGDLMCDEMKLKGIYIEIVNLAKWLDLHLVVIRLI